MKKVTVWFGYFITVVISIFILSLLLPAEALSGKWAIVRSSSMVPALPTGSLALMVPVNPEKIEIGDIITFKPPWDPDVTVSHRVVGIHHNTRLLFDTKGDALEETDPYYVPAERIQGRVIFNIPYLGFVVNYALKYIRTWWGFAFLVAIPSLFIIFNTMIDVFRPLDLRNKRLAVMDKKRKKWKIINYHKI